MFILLAEEKIDAKRPGSVTTDNESLVVSDENMNNQRIIN